jgi:hypothetical protein
VIKLVHSFTFFYLLSFPMAHAQIDRTGAELRECNGTELCKMLQTYEDVDDKLNNFWDKVQQRFNACKHDRPRVEFNINRQTSPAQQFDTFKDHAEATRSAAQAGAEIGASDQESPKPTIDKEEKFKAASEFSATDASAPDGTIFIMKDEGECSKPIAFQNRAESILGRVAGKYVGRNRVFNASAFVYKGADDKRVCTGYN